MSGWKSSCSLRVYLGRFRLIDDGFAIMYVDMSPPVMTLFSGYTMFKLVIPSGANEASFDSTVASW